MATGILLQLDRLNVIDVEIGALIWPVIIILVGLSLLFGQGFSRPRVTDKDKTDLFAALAGIDTKVTSLEYKGGKVSAMMGGWDNKTAQPTNKKAPVLNINVSCSMGGVEVKD